MNHRPPADEPGKPGPALAPGSYGMPMIGQGVDQRSRVRPELQSEVEMVRLKQLKINLTNRLATEFNRTMFRRTKETLFAGAINHAQKANAHISWCKKRDEMAEKRIEIIKEIREIEQAMLALKPKIREERRTAIDNKNAHKEWVHTPSFQAIIDLLGEIRDEIRLMRLFPGGNTGNEQHDSDDDLED